MKTYTLEDLHELYNELKNKWGYCETKDFLEVLKHRENNNK